MDNIAVIFVSNGEALQGSDSRFGSASSDEFWLDDVQCMGTEASIAECPHNGWGKENCGTSEAAKVICTYPVKYIRIIINKIVFCLYVYACMHVRAFVCVK